MNIKIMSLIPKVFQKKTNKIESKNMSKKFNNIYGLQTCLDFDKAPEIAGNLFQLYEFARQKVISSLTKKDADGINQAITVIREILDGWQNIAIEDRKL